jgi:Outer membrane protein beta-barrel domain
MKRLIALLLIVTAIGAATPAFAQESAPGPGKVVITVIPAGATFFTEAENSTLGPSFGSYDLGGSVTVNFNRYVGIEGEVSGAIGVPQSLQVGTVTLDDERSPDSLNYSGNLVISAPNRSSVVPYLTGGVGGQTLFEQRVLDVNDSTTFLTGNVGGGISWYAGRWGIRGDYRFIAVQSKDDAPAFFGREDRYGHRVYAGVLLNVSR